MDSVDPTHSSEATNDLQNILDEELDIPDDVFANQENVSPPLTKTRGNVLQFEQDISQKAFEARNAVHRAETTKFKVQKALAQRTNDNTLLALIRGIRDDIASMNARSNRMESDVASINRISVRMEGDINTMKGEMTTMKGDITTMKGEMTTMKGDITTMKGEMTTMKGDITTMKGEMTTMKGDITTMKGDITTMKGEMTTMKGDITTMKGDITTMKGEMTTMKGDITTMKDDIGGIKPLMHFVRISENARRRAIRANQEPVPFLEGDGPVGTDLPPVTSVEDINELDTEQLHRYLDGYKVQYIARASNKSMKGMLRDVLGFGTLTDMSFKFT